MNVKWIVVGVALLGGACGEGAANVLDDAGPEWTEPDTGEKVGDGDVLAEQSGAQVTTAQGLTVALFGGRDDVWSTSARRRLTYCIDLDSFGNAGEAVRRALASAITDWEASANVHFAHLGDEDANCSRTNPRVVFNVRGVSGRPYLARSFFPSHGRASRELLVDGSALPPPSPLTLPGVLRHELGHTLGLRHEHTRQRENPCWENAQWRAVTAYDVRSVMHYPQCWGLRDRDLVLSHEDRAGIQLLYP